MLVLKQVFFIAIQDQMLANLGLLAIQCKTWLLALHCDFMIANIPM